MSKPTVAILGASADRAKFGNKSVRAHARAGYEVYPVNPSGGLSCFGEAIPAQAIAQVCECVWQLRGTASGRQVEDARVAVVMIDGMLRPCRTVMALTRCFIAARAWSATRRLMEPSLATQKL